MAGSGLNSRSAIFKDQFPNWANSSGRNLSHRETAAAMDSGASGSKMNPFRSATRHSGPLPTRDDSSNGRPAQSASMTAKGFGSNSDGRQNPSTSAYKSRSSCSSWCPESAIRKSSACSCSSHRCGPSPAMRMHNRERSSCFNSRMPRRNWRMPFSGASLATRRRVRLSAAGSDRAACRSALTRSRKSLGSTKLGSLWICAGCTWVSMYSLASFPGTVNSSKRRRINRRSRVGIRPGC